MKKLFKILAIVFTLTLTLAPLKTKALQPYFIDETPRLTTQQQNNLNSKLEKISTDHKLDVVFLLTNHPVSDIVKFADDYWDERYNLSAGQKYPGVLFVLTSDNEYYFSTCGLGQEYFTDYGLKQLDSFFKNTYYSYSNLADGERMYKTLDALATEMERYIITAENDKPIDYYYNRIAIHLTDNAHKKISASFEVYENGHYVGKIRVYDGEGYLDIEDENTNAIYVIKCVEVPDGYQKPQDITVTCSKEYDVTINLGDKATNFGLLTGTSLGAGLLSALIACSAMKAKNKSVTKSTTANTYTKTYGLNLYAKRDIYLYSRHSRTPIVHNDSSSSGSSGGSSSHGGSYSGGSSSHRSSRGVEHGGGGHGRL